MNQVISADFVETLVYSLGCHALLKDTSTNKYIAANETHIKTYDFSKPQDIIGHDIWGLNDIMSEKWEENAKEVSSFDEQVVYTGKTLVYPRRMWLNAQGFVWVHCLRKIPVSGENSKIIAVLSLGDDLTKTLSLDELYASYKYFYKDKRQAIAKFFEHVGIPQDLFYEIPNNNEVRTLIAKAKFHTNKIVATHLGLALKTTDHYIYQLGRKTKNLQIVLEILRLWY